MTSDGHINALSNDVTDFITAAQIVTDLDQALRELLDNALDAGATSIEIKLKNKGAELIEVIDNGKGIQKQDFEMLAKPHCTSKLRDMTDFNDLYTYGFRGQALNSLAKFSILSIKTKSENDNVGSKISFDDDGNFLNSKPIARGVGTTVAVQNLFHKIPVRRKELLDRLEFHYKKMLHSLQAYALCKPEIQFSCKTVTPKYSNVIVTKGMNSTLDVIQLLFGKSEMEEISNIRPREEIAKLYGAEKCSEKVFMEVLQLSGYVSNLSTGSSSSENQFLFVNGRHIEHPKVNKIVNTLYRSRRKDRYPMFVFFVSTHPSRINVCITPDKRTITIRDEHVLLSMIHEAVIKAFELENSTFTPLSTKSQDSVPFRVNSGSQKIQEKDVKSENTVAIRKRPAENSIFSDDEMNENNRKSENSKRSAPSKNNSKKGSHERNIFRSLHTIPDGKSKEDTGMTVRADEFGFFIDDGITELVEEEPFSILENQNDVDGLQNFNVVDSNNTVDNASGHECYPEEDEENISRYATHISPEIPRVNTVQLSSDNITQENQQLDSGNPMDEIIEYESPVNQEVFNAVDHVTIEQYFLDENNTPYQEQIQNCDVEIIGNNDVEVIGEPFYYSGSLVSHTTTGLPEFTFQIPVDTKLMCLPDSVPKAEFEPKMLQVDGSSEDYREWAEADIKFFTDFYNNVDMVEPHVSYAKDTGLRVVKMLTENEQDEDACFNDVKEVASEFETKLSLKKSSFKEMTVHWQFNKSFIFCTLGKSLFIVDQHAANEKYNYEQLWRKTMLKVQHLVCPLSIILSPVQMQILLTNSSSIKNSGFRFSTTDECNKVNLTGVPAYGATQFGVDEFFEAITFFGEYPNRNIFKPDRLRPIFASKACRSSVMVGDDLSLTQMKTHVQRLSELSDPWNCPHGRPTIRLLRMNINQ